MAEYKKPKTEEPQGAALVGYARVSTDDQSLDMQTSALKKAGCINIYEEKISGTKVIRGQLELAMRDLRPGDTLVVWRMDRLARSISDLLNKLKRLEEAGAKFRSLTESIDTSTASGRLIIHILGSIAEFEAHLTRERTRAGLARARERGMVLGAKRVFDVKKKKAIQADMVKTHGRSMSLSAIAKKHKVAVSSIYNNFPGGKYKLLLARKRKSN